MMDDEIAQLEEELERKRLEAQIKALEVQLQARGIVADANHSVGGKSTSDVEEYYHHSDEVDDEAVEEYEEEVEYMVDEYGNEIVEEYYEEDDEEGVIYDDENEEYVVEEYEEELEDVDEDDALQHPSIEPHSMVPISSSDADTLKVPPPIRATTVPKTWPPSNKSDHPAADATTQVENEKTGPPTSTGKATNTDTTVSPFGVKLRKVSGPSSTRVTNDENHETNVEIKSYTARNPPPPSARPVISGTIRMPSHSPQAKQQVHQEQSLFSGTQPVVSNSDATVTQALSTPISSTAANDVTSSRPKQLVKKRVVKKSIPALAPTVVPDGAIVADSTSSDSTVRDQAKNGFMGSLFGRKKKAQSDVVTATTTTSNPATAADGPTPGPKKKIVRRVVVVKKKTGANVGINSNERHFNDKVAIDAATTTSSPPENNLNGSSVGTVKTSSSTTPSVVAATAGSIVKPQIKKYTPEGKAASAAQAAQAANEAAQPTFRPRRINTGIHPSQEGYENLWECCLGPRQIMNAQTMNKCSTNAALTGMDLLLLYFGAKWRPECRQFNSKIIDFYKTCCVPNRVECIYVSADRSLLEFK
jgi:hypothetical protein